MANNPTKHQLLALRLAVSSCFLRCLAGGYWVGSEIRNTLVPPEGKHVGTQTVMACHNRGWLEVAGDKARLTDLGRAVLLTGMRPTQIIVDDLHRSETK